MPTTPAEEEQPDDAASDNASNASEDSSWSGWLSNTISSIWNGAQSFDIFGYLTNLDLFDVTGDAASEGLIKDIEEVDNEAEAATPDEVPEYNLPFLRPDQIQGHVRSEVKTSATSKDNILELINPTILEYFLGAFLLFALILFSSREAERKDEYLLVGNHCDEL
jgi:hypothetical protein